MRYILFLGIPKSIERSIDVVRKDFQAKSLSLWSSHITIKYDENFLLSQKEFVKIVRQFYKDVGVLSVKIGKPKIRFMKNSGSWNIYLPVTSKHVKDLVKKFSKSVERYIDTEAPGALVSTKWEQSKNFQLHISLKGGVGRKEGMSVYKQLQKKDFGFELPCVMRCDIVTVAQWRGKKWIKICDVRLMQSRRRIFA